MKRTSTHFLRAVVFLLGAVALLLAYLLLPAIWKGWSIEYPYAAQLKYPFLISLAATIIPFFIALYQTLRLLTYIDNDTAFSAKSITALRRIKYCALIFSALYVACLPPFYIFAEDDDAPGVVVIGMAMAFAPIVIAVFAAVLQKLLENAIAIKSENELTV